MTPLFDPEIGLHDVAIGAEDSPCGYYRTLLSQCPVSKYDSPEGFSLWGIMSHEEVAKAVMDVETFSSVTVPEGSPRILPLMADPPEQTAYRRLMHPFFNGPAMARTEEEMRPVAAALLAGLAERGTADFAGEFAYPFSTQVLCMYLRVEGDWSIYNDWSAEMERLTRSGMAKPGSSLPMDHFAKVMPYLQQLVTHRRANPGDDVVSGIINGEINGQALGDEAVIGLVIALILAGRSTTASGMGNLVLRLARDQALQDHLRKNPARIADAVEECLRIDTPQQEQPRKATKDVEVGGQLIKAGDAVFLSFGSANVDPASWDQPELFDIDRASLRHLAFGKGHHMCTGAPLARVEMRVVIEELLRCTESFQIAGEVQRKTWPRLSVEQLPLTLVPIS